VKPTRTDFKGYVGKYVATDTRTGQVVIADENLKVVLEKARELDHVVVGGGFPTQTSRSTSALAEPKTPWLYPYREDPQQTRLGQPGFRPFLPVSLAI
jgi:hypothetical protein